MSEKTLNEILKLAAELECEKMMYVHERTKAFMDAIKKGDAPQEPLLVPFVMEDDEGDGK